jgi:hypothetical protein
MSAIFITEALLKSIVQGFLFNGPGSYLKNGWNIFDFFIVLVSAATEIGYFINIENSILEIFNILRVLRSFRILSKNEGVRHTVIGLVYTFPGILNISIVVAL